MRSLYNNLIKKHFLFRKRAEDIYSWPTARPDWEVKYFSTTLLSDVWQNWCHFCRIVVIRSCEGTTTRTGVHIPPRPLVNTWQRISYESKQASNGKPIHPSKALNSMRHEPTWGDQRLLLRAIPQLSPHNAGALVTGFGLSLNAPKHIQIIRNACFHTNTETMSEVRRLVAFYVGRNLYHPTDIMWWVEPTSKADAIFHWLEELEIIAAQVTH